MSLPNVNVRDADQAWFVKSWIGNITAKQLGDAFGEDHSLAGFYDLLSDYAYSLARDANLRAEAERLFNVWGEQQEDNRYWENCAPHVQAGWLAVAEAVLS